MLYLRNYLGAAALAAEVVGLNLDAAIGESRQYRIDKPPVGEELKSCLADAENVAKLLRETLRHARRLALVEGEPNGKPRPVGFGRIPTASADRWE